MTPSTLNLEDAHVEEERVSLLGPAPFNVVLQSPIAQQAKSIISNWRRLVAPSAVALFLLVGGVLLVAVNQPELSFRAKLGINSATVRWEKIRAHPLVPDSRLTAERWIVITTINYPTEAVISLAGLKDWKVVVVGDIKTPKDWALEGVVYLGIEEQLRLGYRITRLLPFRNYGRKNIGYLYAIQHGAQVIYETDDDNILLSLNISTAFDVAYANVRSSKMLVYVQRENRSVVNPYIHFGQPSIWPRGYPLDAIADNVPERNYLVANGSRLPYIKQGLANGDPDVDAIFRLTRASAGELIRVSFDADAPPVALPPGTMCPFNSQNTLFHREALWGMLLPVTTSFRVCDIWRGYWAERLVQDIGGLLAFYAPSVQQNRNAHDYFDDFVSETALYFDGRPLVDFLLSWRSTKPHFFDRVLELSQEMAARGFWGAKDAELTAAWLSDLISVGYEPPPLLDAQPLNGQIKPSEKGKATVAFLPKSLPSSYLAVPKVLEEGRSNRLEEWAKMREYFRDVVLVVNYNFCDTANKSAGFWRALYGRIFPNIVMVSNEDSKELGIEKTPVTQVKRPSSSGFYAYSALPGIMARYPQARGVLWTNDDLILNYWNFVGANKSRIWFLGPNHEGWNYANATAGVAADARHANWWTQEHAVVSFVRAWDALPQPYRRSFEAAISPQKNVFVKAIADTFYVPMRLREPIAKLTHIFLTNAVRSEIALPCMFFCLDLPANFDSKALRDVDYRWNKGRVRPEAKYNASKSGFHPWKVTSPIEKDKIVAAMSAGDSFL